MKNNANIRAAKKADHPVILDLWVQSVLSTHHFLPQEDFDSLHAGLRDAWLDGVAALYVFEEAGAIRGFIGLNPPKVEMLFVLPEAFGIGIGTALLDFARERWPALTVDVNEQNPAARDFYKRYGFEKTGRSERDAQGKPYPLIHMRFAGARMP